MRLLKCLKPILVEDVSVEVILLRSGWKITKKMHGANLIGHYILSKTIFLRPLEVRLITITRIESEIPLDFLLLQKSGTLP